MDHPFHTSRLVWSSRLDFQAMYIYDILIHAVYVFLWIFPIYTLIYSLHTNIFHNCYIYHASGDSFSPMKNQPDPQSPDEFVGSFSRSFSSSTPKTPFPFAPSALQSAELVKAVSVSRGNFRNISQRKPALEKWVWGGLEEGKQRVKRVDHVWGRVASGIC